MKVLNQCFHPKSPHTDQTVYTSPLINLKFDPKLAYLTQAASMPLIPNKSHVRTLSAGPKIPQSEDR